MAGDETQQLAKIAKVAEDLDKMLDKLFASVDELKVILAAPPGPDAAKPGPDPGRQVSS